MSDLLSENEKLAAQAELMNLALDSVPNQEMAKELIAGKFTDAYLVKIRIDIENQSGVGLALISKTKRKLLVVYCLVGNSPTIRKIRTFEDFNQISHDMVNVVKDKGIDDATSQLVGRAIHRVFNKDKLDTYIKQWDLKEPGQIAPNLDKIVAIAANVVRVKSQVEVEKVSSVKFRYRSVLDGMVTPIPEPEDEPEELHTGGDSAVPDNLSPVQRQIQKVKERLPGATQVECRSVLAPVGGVEFDALQEGQEILFRVVVETPAQKTMASALGALTRDNTVRPIIGRYLGMAVGKGEYHIFAEGPSGSLLHALEESPVRLGVPKSSKSAHLESADKGMGLLNLFVGVGLFLAVALIAVLVFF